ncbi:MAG: hypothetical protein D5R96_04320 [Methanocalculus sp. MSAO_Arc2]|uniref:hypothetical protein n=1 Tax=Methanocalculus sp. MSAO_Arc2 TaxID=2293855 RepID=UPI000FF87126|nr:MAG: hypothetical protein D5R96_04320 [Methanocalculus sp. MSAO_Arc2]
MEEEGSEEERTRERGGQGEGQSTEQRRKNLQAGDARQTAIQKWTGWDGIRFTVITINPYTVYRRIHYP